MPSHNFAAQIFHAPSILLAVPVDCDMYRRFRDQLNSLKPQQMIVVELSNLGGDSKVARIMGEDVRAHSESTSDCRYVFLGKVAIYSAGTTFMSFLARPNRYLTSGTRLTIYERKLDKTLKIDGPLSTCVATVKATLNEIESSVAIQNEGFANLIVGSQVTMDEVLKRPPANRYIEAQEVLALGLIEDVL